MQNALVNQGACNTQLVTMWVDDADTLKRVAVLDKGGAAGGVPPAHIFCVAQPL
jgi:hypothetical protein